MGTIPTTPSFTAGEKLTAAKLEQVCDAVDFWALTPRCYAYRSVVQSISTATYTAVDLDAEVYDIVQSGDTASHSTSTDPSRIYVRTAGKYEIAGQVMFNANATGARIAQVRLNGVGTVLSESSQQAITTVGIDTGVPFPTVELALTAGDYIELFAYQGSGGNLDVEFGQGRTFLRLKLTGS